MNRELEIECLKREVEKQFGVRTETSTDFISLSDSIRNSTHETVSDSTLKRLWGYVSYSPVPHESTLDILAKYLGHQSFRSFCLTLEDSSSFFICEKLTAEQLQNGALVTIGWTPDREVLLKYIGTRKFVVLDGGTSKLKIGDIFECGEFLKGVPLFIGELTRDGQTLPSYVAGKSVGLTKLEIKD